MITVLILDDELINVENLAYILEKDCQQVKISFKTTNPQLAYDWLQQNSVDAIFLDIEMPEQDGFEFLKRIGKNTAQIIFVTAYSHYSLRAIKAGALDYILKPVSIDEVKAVIDKVKAIRNDQQKREMNQELLEEFFKHNHLQTAPKRIALPQLGTITYVDVDDIISLEAQSNYTIIYKKSVQKQLVSRTLKEFESILDDHTFIRIHKSYIINMSYVKEYTTADGSTVTMKDGNQWRVSRRQLDHFLEKMKGHSFTFKKN